LENNLAVSQMTKNIELPYVGAVPLLGKYPREMKMYVHRKTCT
jgi:protein involved in polysaccharide export with SLBB domain